MSRFVRALPVVMLTASLVAPAATGMVNGSSGPPPPSNGPNPATLTRDLRASGFRVNPGYPMLWSQEACQQYLYPAFKTCFGNNPVSPYVIPVVKAWPNEHVGPSRPNAFGKVRPGYTPFYRLDPREALVFYGKMPPPGKFMGLQTFEWSQPGHWKTEDFRKWAHTPDRPYPMQYLFETIPPDDPKADRTLSWTSLGDSVNDVVMRRQSGDPWGRTRYFITTPSATTDQAVRRALEAQGVSSSHIFTEKIPSRDELGRIGPLGMGKNAIDFYTFFRYAIPDDQVAAQRWFARPPLTVLRVRAPSGLGPVQRYGMLTYGKRTAQSEAYLAGDLRDLVQAVCDRVRRSARLRSADCAQPPPDSSFVPDPAQDYGWNAPYCRKTHMFCGDQHDAGLYWTKPLPLDAGQVYAVVDTLATETGNATYVGLGVNDASRFLSPTGVTDATLKGSAHGYAATVEHPGKFFVHYFTRSCAVLEGLPGRPQNCTEITPQMVPPKGITNAPGHPSLRGMFWPGLRDYIAPGTEYGPDTSKLLRPRILTFTGR